jgi:hypothetical protein
MEPTHLRLHLLASKTLAVNPTVNHANAAIALSENDLCLLRDSYKLFPWLLARSLTCRLIIDGGHAYAFPSGVEVNFTGSVGGG